MSGPQGPCGQHLPPPRVDVEGLGRYRTHAATALPVPGRSTDNDAPAGRATRSASSEALHCGRDTASHICHVADAVDPDHSALRLVPAQYRSPVSLPHLEPVRNDFRRVVGTASRSEEHTSELQSLMRISYAVFC